MKVLALVGDAPNHRALCSKIDQHFELVGVVVSRNRVKQSGKRKLRRLYHSIIARTVGLPLSRAWNQMQAKYEFHYPDLPACPQVNVTDANDETVLAFARKIKPELTVVSGTNLLKRETIAALNATSTGILNLHTGISPYVKGGPNCTNWCLAKNWLHLIGNTVMWIDSGVDSGDLIGTERTPLDGTEDLSSLHWKVMEHAHDLYLRSISLMVSGAAVPRIPQAGLDPQREFRNSEWGAASCVKAILNFTIHFRTRTLSAELRQKANEFRCFPIQNTHSNI